MSGFKVGDFVLVYTNPYMYSITKKNAVGFIKELRGRVAFISFDPTTIDATDGPGEYGMNPLTGKEEVQQYHYAIYLDCVRKVEDYEYHNPTFMDKRDQFLIASTGTHAQRISIKVKEMYLRRKENGYAF